MKIHLIIILAILTVIFSGCEKEYILTSEQAESQVVIDALVTNVAGRQYVKLSRTANFYDSGKTPRITDATVTVSDDLGNTTVYAHNPNDHPDSAGYYLPPAGFTGAIGRTYTLSVQVGEQQFTGSDQMLSVSSIDSLKYRQNADEFEDPEDPGYFFEVLIYTREPAETKDYYLFNFYRNDSLTLNAPTDIYFSDDVVLGEEINGIASPVFYAAGDQAKVEAMSLTRQGYVFYSDLSLLLNNDGGMFSPPPANCRNNLSGGALGFFQVSAVDTATISIE